MFEKGGGGRVKRVKNLLGFLKIFSRTIEAISTNTSLAEGLFNCSKYRIDDIILGFFWPDPRQRGHNKEKVKILWDLPKKPK